MNFDSIWIFTNGMVSVFSSPREQIPELQGQWNDKKHLILESAKEDTHIYFCQYGYGALQISKDVASRLSLEMPI